jgi:rRNA maturation endonuclease Nob1
MKIKDELTHREEALRCDGCKKITCTTLAREYACEECGGLTFRGVAKMSDADWADLDRRLTEFKNK